MSSLIFLSPEDCREVLTEDDVLRSVDEALRLGDEGGVRWSVPRSMRVGGGAEGSRFRVKACAVDAVGLGGVRVLVHASGGGETRWVILYDDATGTPRAIIDERWTYAQRSVATLLLVAERLAVPPVRKVALIGAGRMAHASLAYVARLFPQAAVAITSRREERRSRLSAIARERGLTASPLPAEDAVKNAQVVVGCTNARTAVLDDGWVGRGTVVASLDPAECGPDFYFRADLRIVDSREQLDDELRARYGKEAPERVDATMGAVITGRHPGRTAAGQRMLLLSEGLASHDVILAGRAYEGAVARGVGTALTVPS